MRLTLRTMLAYLDGILEPADSQDLAKKVEDSEFATGLMHRIRDVMRRLRLGAPSLKDGGPRLDPNTVAEYLDNTLPSEQVTDFERVCLDSDVHLAEVASCHQILTLVLGEPAEIDPMSRQRMYQVKDAPAEAAAEPPPTVGPPPPRVAQSSTPPVLPSQVGRGEGESGSPARRQKPTVPEYLREGEKKHRWMPITALVVLVVCITIMVLMAKGQFEPHTPLGDALVRLGIIKPAREAAAGPTTTTPVTVEATKGNELSQPTETVAEPNKASPAEQATAPVVEETNDGASGAKPSVEQPSNGVMNLPPPEPATKPGAVPPGQTAEVVAKTEPKPEADMSATLKILPEAPPEAATRKEPEAKQPVVAAPALPPEPLGRLMTADQVLLRNDTDVGWTRIGANQMLMPGRLLTLPSYRTKVTLTIGVTLDMVADTQLDFLGSGPQEVAGIRVSFGRLVMMPLAKAGARLRVQFGDHRGEITFTDPNSEAALEVRRVRAAGTNPESGPSVIAADLYAVDGGIAWDEMIDGKAADTVRVTSGQRMGFEGPVTSPPVAAKEMPKWRLAKPLGRLESGASKTIEQMLQTEGPARVGLREAAQRPQKEVRWLALRCLSYLGQFHDMASALNDPAHKLDWTDHIDQLCEAVGRDAASAAAVRQTLAEQYPQYAAELYRMLWGYTDEDLQSGSDRELVDGLDSDLLAVRVLSVWNLTKLTGLGKIYQAEQTAAKRKPATQRWQQRLKASEIRLKSPEERTGAAARESPAETTSETP